MANKIRTSTGWLAGAKASIFKQKADYLSSPKGLIKETIKGLPKASKKVGGVMIRAPFRATKAIGKAIKGTPLKTLSSEEARTRIEERLNKMRNTIKKWKESHPGYKIPKEFKDLE